MKWLALGWFLAFTLHADNIPAHCEYDKTCVIEVPGMVCADGTPSYITLTAREGARDLLIYLSGGGACWSKKSCEEGFATTLTRKPPSLDWNGGKGIFNRADPSNPFRAGYHIVAVPYCTGDVFGGEREINYGSNQQPYVIRHRGFSNAMLAFQAAQAIVEKPERLALVGQSAGGLGTLFHVKTVTEIFPHSKTFVVNDAGVPFKEPHLPAQKIELLSKNWGVKEIESLYVSDVPLNFGELIRYNKRAFPNVRYGLVASYRDPTMSFFAVALEAPSPFSAVRSSLVDAFKQDIGTDAQNTKVFYLNDSVHTYLGRNLDEVVSGNEKLNVWLNRMIEGENSWANVGVMKAW